MREWHNHGKKLIPVCVGVLLLMLAYYPQFITGTFLCGRICDDQPSGQGEVVMDLIWWRSLWLPDHLSGSWQSPDSKTVYRVSGRAEPIHQRGVAFAHVSGMGYDAAVNAMRGSDLCVQDQREAFVMREGECLYAFPADPQHNAGLREDLLDFMKRGG